MFSIGGSQSQVVCSWIFAAVEQNFELFYFLSVVFVSTIHVLTTYRFLNILFSQLFLHLCTMHACCNDTHSVVCAHKATFNFRAFFLSPFGSNDQCFIWKTLRHGKLSVCMTFGGCPLPLKVSRCKYQATSPTNWRVTQPSRRYHQILARLLDKRIFRRKKVQKCFIPNSNFWQK